MTKQNLFIINFNSLYEILDEVKENLSFKIINHKNEGSFFKDQNFNKKNSLVIIKPNNKLNVSKNCKIK